MCWKCGKPNGAIEKYLDEVRTTIGEHEWAVQFVASGKSPLAHAVGLHRSGLPEFIITGMDSQLRSTAARLC